MILGLPWSSWLLLLVAVGLGFGISLAFFLAHRGEDAEDPGAGAGPGPGPGPGSSRPTGPDHGNPSDGSNEPGASSILDSPPGRG